MSSSNVDFIYHEYPFLDGIFPRKDVTSANVIRCARDFLDVANTDYTRIYLLDADGTIITRLGNPNWLPSIFSALMSRETVGQALHRLGDRARLVRYAAEIQRGLRKVTFYRIPSEHKDAVAWLESMATKETQPNHGDSWDNRERFQTYFGFSVTEAGGPSTGRYQKEALLKMALLARAAQTATESASKEKENNVFRNPNAQMYPVQSYNSAADILKIYMPELAKNIPHWSEFPAFLDQWIKGEGWEDLFPTN